MPLFNQMFNIIWRQTTVIQDSINLIFIIFPALPGGYGWELSAFIIGVFLQLLGLPFVAVSQVSLFSKVTAEKTQGLQVILPSHLSMRHVKKYTCCICSPYCKGIIFKSLWFLTKRIQPRYQTLSWGPGHHLGSFVGWRIDQKFVHNAGHDASSPHNYHSE